MDEDACWRWAFRRGYGRRPKAAELERYKFWHKISRQRGFTESGPWETWPAKPIPPDAKPLPTPAPAPERTSSRDEVVAKAEPTDHAIIARSVPEPVDQPENQLSGGDKPQVNTEKRATFKPEKTLENQCSRGDGHQVSTEKPASSKPAPAPEMRNGNRHGNSSRRGRPPKMQEAQALLRKQLAGGPKPGAEIEAAALEASIPERALLSATDALGVRTQRGQWWLPN